MISVDLRQRTIFQGSLTDWISTIIFDYVKDLSLFIIDRIEHLERRKENVHFPSKLFSDFARDCTMSEYHQTHTVSSHKLATEAGISSTLEILFSYFFH